MGGYPHDVQDLCVTDYFIYHSSMNGRQLDISLTISVKMADLNIKAVISKVMQQEAGSY